MWITTSSGKAARGADHNTVLITVVRAGPALTTASLLPERPLLSEFFLGGTRGSRFELVFGFPQNWTIGRKAPGFIGATGCRPDTTLTNGGNPALILGAGFIQALLQSSYRLARAGYATRSGLEVCGGRRTQGSTVGATRGWYK